MEYDQKEKFYVTQQRALTLLQLTKLCISSDTTKGRPSCTYSKQRDNLEEKHMEEEEEQRNK